MVMTGHPSPGFRRPSRSLSAPAQRAGAALLLSLLLGASAARAEIKEQIVAVINDDIITYSELEKILSPIFEQYEQIYSGAELFAMLQKARRDVLNHLIEEKLIIQEAKKSKVRELMGDDFAKEVEQSISEIRRKFPSEKEFLAKLKREGSTPEKFREHEEERTLVRAVLVKEISSRCSVSPLEVKEYYDSRPEEFTEGEKIHVSQIWIKEAPEKQGEAKRLAKEILRRIDAGEPFAELARKYSRCPYAARGGDWGFIGRGHWTMELEEPAFALSPGEHSGVIKTELGYHIIMLHEKLPATRKPLKEVYSDIERKLFSEKVDARRREWIERLRKKAYVSVVK